MTAATKAKLARWVESLDDEPDAPGHTSAELAAAWGRCPKTARERIRALIAKGVLRKTGRRRTVRSDGRLDWQPVYDAVEPAKKGRK